jgi:hypothetical protein
VPPSDTPLVLSGSVYFIEAGTFVCCILLFYALQPQSTLPDPSSVSLCRMSLSRPDRSIAVGDSSRLCKDAASAVVSAVGGHSETCYLFEGASAFKSGGVARRLALVASAVTRRVGHGVPARHDEVPATQDVSLVLRLRRS